MSANCICTYLLMGLDMAKGVGTPMAFILCCMVGLGGRPGLRPTGCWLSGERGSGVWLRDILKENQFTITKLYRFADQHVVK